MAQSFLIGHNIHTSHGFVSSAEFAKSIGCNFYQIFLGSPQNYNPKRHTTEELDGLKAKLVKHSIKIVVHANYMLNFCNPVTTSKHQLALKLLVNDLKDSVKIGAIGVIIHMGKQLDLRWEDAVNNYVLGVQRALKNSPKESTIILETGAGVGTEICSSIIDLGLLYKRFTKEERSRIKFCIDTCHVFSSGYDLSSSDYVEKVFDIHISNHLGWENIACVHLNDSKCALNSKKDRHMDVGRGIIGTKGLKSFVKICCNRSVPVVLETPCENGFTRSNQISLVKTWVDDV